MQFLMQQSSSRNIEWNVVLDILKLLSLPDAVKFCKACGIYLEIIPLVAHRLHGTDIIFLLFVQLDQ